MVDLTRTVRFCINDGAEGAGPDGDNTFAGSPPMRGLGRYYELEITCRGVVDPVSGYFLNIKLIDGAVRRGAVPLISRACGEHPGAEPAGLLAGLAAATERGLGVKDGTVRRVRWKLTPTYSVERCMDEPKIVLIRQSFEFAASHRLHSPGLSDEQNRAMFGKCNHPHGHGHNYRIEPCVAVRLKDGRGRFGLLDLERVTARVIVDHFDHKHLNEDVPEFRCRDSGGGGLNPSVENIAVVCFERLGPAVAAGGAGGDAELRSVTVWETDKTSCTYPPAGART